VRLVAIKADEYLMFNDKITKENIRFALDTHIDITATYTEMTTSVSAKNK